MTVVGSRIDNRLLHGIVATQWAPQSGATRVMVIDDKVANDPIAKESMKLGRPSGMAVSIITQQIAMDNFLAGKYDNQKVFIVTKTPDIYLALINQGVIINEIILGGTVVPDGEAIKVSKRAYVLSNQIDIYNEIMKKNTNVLVKFVPSDKDVNLQNLL